MNKLYTFIILAFFTARIYSQDTSFSKAGKLLSFKQSGIHTKTRGPVSRPLKSNNFYWDNSQWVNSDSSFYEYNSQGFKTKEIRKILGQVSNIETITYNQDYQITETLYQYYDANTSSIQNSSRRIHEYDNQGNEVETRYETWNGTLNQWWIENGVKRIISYNSNNQVTEELVQYYDQNNQLYYDEEKYTFTYDNLNRLVSDEVNFWNGIAWNNYMKSIYEYNLNEIEPFAFVTFGWNNSAYIPDKKYIDLIWHEFNNNGFDYKLDEYSQQDWDGSNWETNWRFFTTYDTYDGFVETLQKNVSAVWENSDRHTVSYDANLNFLGEKYEYWIVNQWQTANENKNIFSYDVDNNMTQKIEQIFDNATSGVVNSKRYDYGNFAIFNSTLSVVNLQADNGSIYPNPAISEFTVNIGTIKTSSTFILSDLNGKVVLNSSLNHLQTFETTGLNSGCYIYSIHNDSGVIKTGKLIIE